MPMIRQQQRQRTLTDFPDELVLAILSNFEAIRSFGKTLYIQTEVHHQENQQRIRCLASLCLTSRECKRFAQPLLYSALIVQSGRRYRLFTFARTLIENPSLARHIRYIKRTLSNESSWKKHMNDGFGDADWEESIVPVLIISAMNVWKSGKKDGVFEWETLLRRYSGEDAPLALVIALATNLAQLDIAHRVWFPSAFWNVLGLTGNSPCVNDGFLQLRRLRDLAIHQCVQYGSGSETPQSITLHTSLPALRSLHLHGQVIPELNTERVGPSPLPIFSQLRHVHLDFTYAAQADIVNVIRACKALESFRCKWDRRGRRSLAHLPTLLLELSAHSQTLRYLFLINLFLEDYYHSGLPVPAIESLTHFTSLKHLRLDDVALFGAPRGMSPRPDEDGAYWRSNRPQPFSSRLPTSLESIELSCRFPIYEDTLAFGDFAHGCKQFPALEKMRILQSYGKLTSDFLYLTQDFKVHGVEFEVVESSDPNA
ncbi:hypothetical protein BDV96DRAFT_575809 [Lophiotrema nucula]|uniref:F-box domain-containing protein n=1 Tax=Lophiotrema nucula TaxID=690887 RepID=A0A6A5Z6Q4_9PLEO|nr:hypothetical protein BDV96DRAFT_575809 [Lophiotrema nucula]